MSRNSIPNNGNRGIRTTRQGNPHWFNYPLRMLLMMTDRAFPRSIRPTSRWISVLLAPSRHLTRRRLIPASIRPRTHRRVCPPKSELMHSLTGFVWSFTVAFILVALGSIVGESLLFLSFRHFFHSRIVQFRKEHQDNYGTIVQVINEHKRWMVFLIRLSAIPVTAP